MLEQERRARGRKGGGRRRVERLPGRSEPRRGAVAPGCDAVPPQNVGELLLKRIGIARTASSRKKQSREDAAGDSRRAVPHAFWTHFSGAEQNPWGSMARSEGPRRPVARAKKRAPVRIHLASTWYRNRSRTALAEALRRGGRTRRARTLVGGSRRVEALYCNTQGEAPRPRKATLHRKHTQELQAGHSCACRESPRPCMQAQSLPACIA